MTACIHTVTCLYLLKHVCTHIHTPTVDTYTQITSSVSPSFNIHSSLVRTYTLCRIRHVPIVTFTIHKCTHILMCTLYRVCHVTHNYIHSPQTHRHAYVYAFHCMSFFTVYKCIHICTMSKEYHFTHVYMFENVLYTSLYTSHVATHTYTCLPTHTHTYTNPQMHALICLQGHINTHTYQHTLHTYTDTHIPTHTYRYTHTKTHVQTYAYTLKHSCFPLSMSQSLVTLMYAPTRLCV